MSTKVLMFGWEFPPMISGGLGTACQGLTRGLTKLGVQIHFLVPKSCGKEDSTIDVIDASNVVIRHLFKHTTFQGLEEIDIPVSIQPYLSIDLYSEKPLYKVNKEEQDSRYAFMGGYSKNLLYEVFRYRDVAVNVALSLDFDIIHAHDWHSFPAAIAVKEITGKPLVVQIHATEFDRAGSNYDSRIYDIEKRGLEIADEVVTVSGRMKEILIHKYGIQSSKIHVVYNGLEHKAEDYLEISRLPFRIVCFLGRITFQKGPEFFIDAAVKVLKRCPDVHFVMAGSGDRLKECILRVAQLGIGSHFHFTGFLSGQDVERMYRMSDVYVMPSVSEPFGITPLEAMEYKVPTIISKQSGVAELLKYVIKIEYWDVEALANAIYGLLVYQPLRHYQISEAYKEVERISWDKSAEALLNIYNKLL